MQARKRSRPQAQPFQFSLHVRHPFIDPEEISRELQLTAVESFKAGQPRTSRSGVAATALHAETYWVAVVDPTAWPLPAAFKRRVERAAVPAGERSAPEPLPADRHSRLKALIQLGKEQGYLARSQVDEYLPAKILDSARVGEVVRTLADMGISVMEDAQTATAAGAALARLTPQEVRVLRTRFGLEEGAPGGAGLAAVQLLGGALALVCESLLVRHGAFLDQLRAQGGSVALLITLSAQTLGGFRITPKLGHCLAELGLTIEFGFAGDAA